MRRSVFNLGRAVVGAQCKIVIGEVLTDEGSAHGRTVGLETRARQSVASGYVRCTQIQAGGPGLFHGGALDSGRSKWVPLRCSLIKGEPIAPTLGLEASVTLSAGQMVISEVLTNKGWVQGKPGT